MRIISVTGKRIMVECSEDEIARMSDAEELADTVSVTWDDPKTASVAKGIRNRVNQERGGQSGSFVGKWLPRWGGGWNPRDPHPEPLEPPPDDKQTRLYEDEPEPPPGTGETRPG
jgi:hypothetical protein